MARTPLTITLGLKATRAVSNARKAKKGLKDIEKGAKGAGTELGEADEKTKSFGKSLLALGGGAIAFVAITAAVKGMIGSLERALELKQELTRSAITTIGGTAGFASQFGLTETQASKSLGDISVAGAAGGGRLEGIGGLGVSLGSAGVIDKKDFVGGKLNDAASGMMAQMVLFGQHKQINDEALSQMGKLTAKMFADQGLRPNAENTNKVLGQLFEAYSQSESSNWSQFFASITTAVSPAMGETVGASDAVAWFAALQKLEPTERLGASTVKEVITQTFGNAKVREWYGDEWYADKRSGALLSNIIERFAGLDDRELDTAFGELDITGTQSSRIKKFISQRGKQAEILTAMNTRTGVEVSESLERFRLGPRGQRQTTESKIELDETREGLERASIASLIKLADARNREEERNSPVSNFLRTSVQFRSAELSYSVNKLLEDADVFDDLSPGEGFDSILYDGNSKIAFRETYRNPEYTTFSGRKQFLERNVSLEDMAARYPKIIPTLFPVTRGVSPALYDISPTGISYRNKAAVLRYFEERVKEIKEGRPPKWWDRSTSAPPTINTTSIAVQNIHINDRYDQAYHRWFESEQSSPLSGRHSSQAAGGLE